MNTHERLDSVRSDSVAGLPPDHHLGVTRPVAQTARRTTHTRNAMTAPARVCSADHPLAAEHTATTPTAASNRRHAPATASTLGNEMPTPQPKRTPPESLELSVDEVLRRAKPHPPYGEHVIDDLTDEEADAFVEAVLH